MTGLMTQAAALIVLDHYTEELERKDLAPVSIAKYRQQLQQFYSWLGEREPSPKVAELFIAELRYKGSSRATRRSYYAAIRPFMYYLGFTFDLKLKKPERQPKYHSYNEIQRLFQAVIDRNPNDRRAKNKDRDLLILKTLAHAGLRKSELLNLKCQDIKGGFLFVRSGKGEKDRTIPLGRKLFRELAEYCRIDEPRSRVFPLSSNRLHRIVAYYSKKAGLEISPHQLRHYFGTRVIEKGGKLPYLRELMGHEDISTTALYLDVIPKHLQETIDLLEEDNE